MAREILIAIDGGGTRTRCAAYDRTGTLLGEAETGASNHLVVDRATVLAALEKGIAGALRNAAADAAEVRLVSAGLAGVDFDGQGEDEAREILREAGYPRSVLRGDMVIAHAGALGGKPGVMALSGTGAVFLGLSPDGTWAKGGGWGYLFGDEGSAWWIGREALSAAARAFDGRGPATSLLAMVSRALGISDFAQAITRVYVENLEPRGIAALSRLVEEAANAGDAVASNILEAAGRELALGAEAVIRRLNLGAQPAVSCQGAVLRNCARVRRVFEAELKSRVPGAAVMPPVAEPLFGAWLIGCRELGWS
jgi:N-acetylglucosamine kinase-like BadF-type ATPase